MKKRKIIDIYPPSAKIPEKRIDEGDIPIKIKKETVVAEETIAEKEQYSEPEQEPTPVPTSTRRPFIWKLAGIVLGGILLYYLGFVAFTKAEVTITAQRQALDFSGTVLADRNTTQIKYDQAVIPAHMFVFQESAKQTFNSTGKGRDERKAKGTITIYNNYSRSPQILVATTRFETPDHKIYRINSRLVIPGATIENGKLIPSSVDAQVTADKAGADYNIPPCQLPKCKFTIPGFAGTEKFKKFYAVSAKPMKGGSSSAIPLINSRDIKSAENVILDQLMKKLTADSKKKVPTGLIVLDSAQSGVNVNQLKSDASVGDERQAFTVTAQGEKKLIAFQKKNLVQYIQGQLGEKKDKQYDFCGQTDIKYQEIHPNFTKGTLELTFQAEQPICYHLDKKSIKDMILGKKRNELSSVLKNVPGIKEVKVKIQPFWITSIPRNASQVKVSID